MKQLISLYEHVDKEKLRKQLRQVIQMKALPIIKVSKYIGTSPITVTKFIRGSEVRDEILARIINYVEQNIH